ncbi:MAG TPA: acyltransferase [Xanthobacteraceae bacterium]|nr:acyltransferase [Xanthobacteraceae bacterium]
MTGTPTQAARGGADERLSSLDIARSFAALAVVLYHWQHFQFAGYALREGFDRTVQPLYAVLFPFYSGGWLAVDFFFMLSGYIFFWKYQASVAAGAFGAGKFFVLRFSRLYPLHVVTLLAVAALQAVYFARHGGFFVFPFNDLYHFGLQLFLASHWGLERGPSFNDPVWSLSVEVLLYALFFCLARYTRARWPLLLAVSALGFVIYGSNLSNAIGRGLFCFFIGGLLSYALATPPARHSRFEGAVYGAALLLIALALVAGGQIDVFAGTIASLAAGLHSDLAPLEAAVSNRLARVLSYAFIAGLLFPALIASLVLIERRFHAQIQRWSFLGHISYSSYLLHIPLQLACVLLLPGFFTSPSSAASGPALLAFVVVLVALSFASFYGFERPAQTFIRRLAASAEGARRESRMRSQAWLDRWADPGRGADSVASISADPAPTGAGSER